jgi:hypothetical protein
MIKTKIPKQDSDYIEIYAKALKKNPKYFKQQKMLIESQLKISREIFRKRFKTGKKFEINARKYLKNTGRI